MDGDDKFQNIALRCVTFVHTLSSTILERKKRAMRYDTLWIVRKRKKIFECQPIDWLAVAEN
jgi:hypothetical protein